MHPLTIALASDHAGFDLKSSLVTFCTELGFKILDLGTHTSESVDYPDFAQKMAESIHKEQANMGILICGSGIGISIAANRFKHIRAALCTDPETATLARAHNDANVLVLGSRIINIDIAKSCVKTFLTTDFDGGRHMARVSKLNQIGSS